MRSSYTYRLYYPDYIYFYHHSITFSFPLSKSHLPILLAYSYSSHLEELPLFARLNAAVLENRLNTLMVITRDVAWNRTIKRIETVTLDLRHYPEEADAKSASTKSPEKTSKRRCHEGA
jgi:hypothetical protein